MFKDLLLFEKDRTALEAFGFYLAYLLLLALLLIHLFCQGQVLVRNHHKKDTLIKPFKTGFLFIKFNIDTISPLPPHLFLCNI